MTKDPALVVELDWKFKVLAAERKMLTSPPNTKPVEDAVAPLSCVRPPMYKESVVVAALKVSPPGRASTPEELITGISPAAAVCDALKPPTVLALMAKPLEVICCRGDKVS